MFTQRIALLTFIIRSIRYKAKKEKRSVTRQELSEISDYNDECERLYRRMAVGF